MVNAFLLWLLGIFVIDPAVVGMLERLGQVQVPAAVAEQVRACTATAPAALGEKLVANPWWGLRTGVGVAVGLISPEQVLADAGPGCAQAWAMLEGKPRS